MRKPDFERLRKALFCQKTDEIPLAELFHDMEVMDAFMGREVNTTREIVEFYTSAGYDYVPIFCEKWFAGVKGEELEISANRLERRRRRERQIFTDHVDRHFHIPNLDDFQQYDWSHHVWLRGGEDLSYLDYAAGMIPAGMKLIAWSDGIFEFFSKYVGYETFCLSLYDNPEFIEAVFTEVGRRAYHAFKQVVVHPAVGAIWLADDIGFTGGTLWSPELMRRYLFPWYRKIGDAARENAKPFIFHSDGRLWDVVPDLINCGINALQPIEPASWDAVEVKKQYGDRLCIIGTIDLDTICRGTRKQVVELARKHIALLGQDGGFAIGTSNTPTYYMNHDNYRALLETALAPI